MAQGIYPTIITGQVTIDSGDPLPGRITIEQEWIRVRSEHATKPDPSWTLTDDAGHWHAFAEPEKEGMAADLPTCNRETVQMPCDGSCGGICGGEGYSVDRYSCRACGQEIKPRRIPDHAARDIGEAIPGLKDWTLEVESYDRPIPHALGKLFSIRMESETGTFFGIGGVADYRVRHDVDANYDYHAMLTITSAGPLGRRLHAQ